MGETGDDVILFSVPRALLALIVQTANDLIAPMHELLERNTEGELSATEKLELEKLVRIAEFGQILSDAIEGARLD